MGCYDNLKTQPLQIFTASNSTTAIPKCFLFFGSFDRQTFCRITHAKHCTFKLQLCK